MKCPHCGKSVGLFSRALNRLEKKKTCPHCLKPVQVFLDIKMVALLFIPTVLIGVALHLILRAMEMNGSIATGLVAAAMISLSMRLKPA